ncbi:hypothetical protein RIF29_21004 [Crotalaria pallida]|uniref:Uncharacterized protein n=1 Tax=Crotalaria pallida TaxID=3830 RepID=A0AAN9F230_CROPI
MGICRASCVVVVVEESGRLGEGEGEGVDEGTCALVVGEMGTCMASCGVLVVVVESGTLGVGVDEGVDEGSACACALGLAVEESGRLGEECGEGRCELVVEESGTCKASCEVVVVVESGRRSLLQMAS